jgi:hypothetical protein
VVAVVVGRIALRARHLDLRGYRLEPFVRVRAARREASDGGRSPTPAFAASPCRSR